MEGPGPGPGLTALWSWPDRLIFSSGTVVLRVAMADMWMVLLRVVGDGYLTASWLRIVRDGWRHLHLHVGKGRA